MANPLISFVIPMFNSRLFVAETINSALSQEGVEIEIVVVDDGSTDDSHAFLAESGLLNLVTYVRQENSGVSVARNRGMEYCRGEYVCFLDSDDILHTGFCKRLVAVMQESNCRVAYSNYRYFLDSNERPLLNISYPKYQGSVFGQLISDHCIPTTGAVLLQRDAIGDTRFDADLRNAEDWKFWIELSLRERFAYCPDILIDIRFRPASLSRNKENMAKANVALLYRIEQTVLSHSANLQPGELSNYYYRHASWLVQSGAYGAACRRWLSAFRHGLSMKKNTILLGKILLSVLGLRRSVERLLWERRIKS